MRRLWQGLHVAIVLAVAIAVISAGSPLFWGVPTERAASPVDIRLRDQLTEVSANDTTAEDISGSTLTTSIFLAGPGGRLFPAQRVIPTPPDQSIRYCPPNAAPGECVDEPGPGLVETQVALAREEIAGASARSALNVLVGGPTTDERADGISTSVFSDIFTNLFAPVNPNPALPPDVRVTAGGTAVLNIAADSSYVGLAGDSQRLATAQLVWTLTELGGIETVRITVSGADIGIPADGGIAAAGTPVDRSNYSTLVPVPTPSAQSDGTPLDGTVPNAGTDEPDAGQTDDGGS